MVKKTQQNWTLCPLHLGVPSEKVTGGIHNGVYLLLNWQNFSLWMNFFCWVLQIGGLIIPILSLRTWFLNVQLFESGQKYENCAFAVNSVHAACNKNTPANRNGALAQINGLNVYLSFSHWPVETAIKMEPGSFSFCLQLPPWPFSLRFLPHTGILHKTESYCFWKLWNFN